MYFIPNQCKKMIKNQKNYSNSNPISIKKLLLLENTHKMLIEQVFFNWFNLYIKSEIFNRYKKKSY
jgi:hypothetical protein